MNPKFLPVKGYSGLFRDPTTGAIVNKNPNNLENWKKKNAKIIESKQKALKDSNRITILENKVESLSEKLDKILSLLEKKI